MQKSKFDQKQITGLQKNSVKSDLTYFQVLNLARQGSGTPVPENLAKQLGQFRLSTFYDPDAAIGGYQPQGHDQLAALYEDYMILGATVTVKIPLQKYEQDVEPPYIGLNISPNTVDDQKWNPFPTDTTFFQTAKLKLKGYKYCRVPVFGTDKAPRYLKGTYSIKNIQHMFKGEYKEKMSFKYGSVPAPPAQGDIRATIFSHSATSNTKHSRVNGIEVTIKYHVISYDPKNINYS